MPQSWFPADFENADANDGWLPSRRDRRKMAKKRRKNPQRHQPEENETKVAEDTWSPPVQNKKPQPTVEPTPHASWVNWAMSRQNKNHQEEHVVEALRLYVEKGHILTWPPAEREKTTVLQLIHKVVFDFEKMRQEEEAEEEESPETPEHERSEEPVLEQVEEFKGDNTQPQMSIRAQLKHQLKSFNFANPETDSILLEWISKITKGNQDEKEEFRKAFTDDGHLGQLVKKILTSELSRTTTSSEPLIYQHKQNILRIFRNFLTGTPEELRIIFDTLASIAQSIKKSGTVSENDKQVQTMARFAEPSITFLLRKPDSPEKEIEMAQFEPPSETIFGLYRLGKDNVGFSKEDIDLIAHSCYVKLGALNRLQANQTSEEHQPDNLIRQQLEKANKNMNSEKTRIRVTLRQYAAEQEALKRESDGSVDEYNQQKQKLVRMDESCNMNLLHLLDQQKTLEKQLETVKKNVQGVQDTLAETTSEMKVLDQQETKRHAEYTRLSEQKQSLIMQKSNEQECYRGLSQMLKHVENKTQRSDAQILKDSLFHQRDYAEEVKNYMERLEQAKLKVNKDIMWYDSMKQQLTQGSHALSFPDGNIKPMKVTFDESKQALESTLAKIQKEITGCEMQLRAVVEDDTWNQFRHNRANNLMPQHNGQLAHTPDLVLDNLSLHNRQNTRPPFVSNNYPTMVLNYPTPTAITPQMPFTTQHPPKSRPPQAGAEAFEISEPPVSSQTTLDNQLSAPMQNSLVDPAPEDNIPPIPEPSPAPKDPPRAAPQQQQQPPQAQQPPPQRKPRRFRPAPAPAKPDGQTMWSKIGAKPKSRAAYNVEKQPALSREQRPRRRRPGRHRN